MHPGRSLSSRARDLNRLFCRETFDFRNMISNDRFDLTTCIVSCLKVYRHPLRITVTPR